MDPKLPRRWRIDFKFLGLKSLISPPYAAEWRSHGCFAAAPNS